MRDSEALLEKARECFRQAAEAVEAAAMRRYADTGRDYLRRAHEAAKICDSDIENARPA